MKKEIKRNLVTIYFTAIVIYNLVRRYKINCLVYIAKIEFLDCFLSGPISRLLFGLMKHKYDPTRINQTDPYIVSIKKRFSNKSQLLLLNGNIIVLKPYISQDEKGLILLNYSEVINAFPFLFDLKKVQERYHFLIEPSTESPYQMYLKLYGDTSFVFVEALSEREKKQNTAHGYISVPLCAGDWVNERDFKTDNTVEVIYDF